MRYRPDNQTNYGGETMIDFSEYVPDIQFAQIPIKNLVSNQEYQRNLSMVHVRRMANNFDKDQLNPVKVSLGGLR